MMGMNSRVTEHAVYWPRKCSQAAGQSAWLVHPCVTNSPLADESRPLFALSIEASHHQRRPVYLPLQSATHTTSSSFSLPLRRSIHPFSSLSQTALGLHRTQTELIEINSKKTWKRADSNLLLEQKKIAGFTG